MSSEDLNVTQTEDNNEKNEEENDDNDDNILRVLYGDDENDDIDQDEDDEEDDDDSECNDSQTDRVGNNESTALLSGVDSQTNQSVDNRNANSNKRQSTEDSSHAKRVKTEPMSPKRAENERSQPMGGKPLTTTIEMFVSTDECVEIPKNSQEFMTHVLNWNANNLESNDLSPIPMAENLQNINNCMSFLHYTVLVRNFIPAIIVKLWDKLRRVYRQKIKSKSIDKIRLHSILSKKKTQKMKDGLELKCISVRRTHENPVFKFGHLVIINTAVQSKPNSYSHFIRRKSHFAYVCSHTIRKLNFENQNERNQTRLLNDDQKESILIEEVVFLTKFSEEFFMRNDVLIVAKPILNIHNYHLEARALFKFEQFPIHKQILYQIFNCKPSGVLRLDANSNLTETQLDCIQSALDVIASPSLSNSGFLAINGPQNSGKTSTLVELIHQIVKCNEFRDKKVLFTSCEDKCLIHMNQTLKKMKIKTYLIDNDLNESLMGPVKRYIEHKLAKDIVINDEKKKQQYNECLNYFNSNMKPELSIENTLFKNSILDQVRHDLMSISEVIIGRIEEFCNDLPFYKSFANNHAFNCCIIDDSHGISEHQFYSLFWFGIYKFIMAGDIDRESNSEESHVCRQLGLSRSFFQRYVENSANSRSESKNTTTVFNL